MKSTLALEITSLPNSRLHTRPPGKDVSRRTELHGAGSAIPGTLPQWSRDPTQKRWDYSECCICTRPALRGPRIELGCVRGPKATPHCISAPGLLRRGESHMPHCATILLDVAHGTGVTKVHAWRTSYASPRAVLDAGGLEAGRGRPAKPDPHCSLAGAWVVPWLRRQTESHLRILTNLSRVRT